VAMGVMALLMARHRPGSDPGWEEGEEAVLEGDRRKA